MSAPERRSGRKAGLRAANAVISAAMLALFLVHGVGNAFQLIGVGSPLSKGISHGLLTLCVAHVALGAVLTADTLRSRREAGVGYGAPNARFWAVRISGLLIAVLIGCHLLIFWRPASDAVRLAFFGRPQLVVSVLLVLALAVHVLANAQPLLISLGIGAPAERAADAALVVALLLLFMTVAFVVYYLRWSVV